LFPKFLSALGICEICKNTDRHLYSYHLFTFTGRLLVFVYCVYALVQYSTSITVLAILCALYNVYIYVYTYIGYVRTCIRTYIHAYIRTHIHTYAIHIHTHIHTYIHTYIHRYIHTHIHTYIHTYLHTYIHIYIHTNPDARTQFGSTRQSVTIFGSPTPPILGFVRGSAVFAIVRF